MAIAKRPYFPKGSWVRVAHPKHPFHDRVGQIVIGGRESCEVEFHDQERSIKKPFMNTMLQKEERPAQIEPGSAVIVSETTHPYYLRPGVVHAFIAGNEIALVDFGEKFRDEAGNAHQKLAQVYTADLQLHDGASCGVEKGGRKLRSAQG